MPEQRLTPAQYRALELIQAGLGMLGALYRLGLIFDPKIEPVALTRAGREALAQHRSRT